jgi:pantoate--beta-alanine ligase
MKTTGSVTTLRKWLTRARRSGKTIGLVPTMGALHEGHIRLTHHARQIVGPRGVVVVSIFVNPTQFNDPKDLARYPRTLRTDAAMCRAAGVDFIFAPNARAMYSPDFSTWVDEKVLSLPLCGASRPGHFRGVCTVVAKLFNIVQPDVAIFGQKDAQQALVIRRMVRDLDFPIRIVTAPIVREPDGLAMSSRNRRLSSARREVALVLNQALRRAHGAFRNGVRSAASLRGVALDEIHEMRSVRMDYLDLVDPATLRPVKRASRGNLLAVAAFVGPVRLIDNIVL